MKIFNNIILTLSFFILTVLPQVVFYALNDALTLQIPLSSYLGLFIILFIFSFIRISFWRYLAMGFILILSFFQMAHLEYFGLPVHPSEFWLLFAEISEITGTLKEDLSAFLKPVLLVIPSLILLWKLNKKFQPKISSRFLHFLFIFYFIYNPIRTFITGNTWGRQPSTQEFDGMNLYLSTSYFLGKILPYKLSQKKLNTKTNPKITFNFHKPIKRNIILVQAESLSSNHLSLFGYKRKTTPFLESLTTDTNFIYRRGVSSGVSTDVAIAFFMNNTFGLSGVNDVYSGKNCLFNLAKKAEFETYFYSTQSSQQLRYIANSICPKFIDHFKSLENIDPNIKDENAADDHKLLDFLKEVPLEEGNKFITLHQRGSHSPYNLRFNKKSDVFSGNTGTGKDDTVNFYDNSVYHNDLFFKELISYIKTLRTPTTIIIVSDHGEGMGENGVWGHGMLKKESFEIPILIYTQNDDLIKEKSLALQTNPTHLNASLLISYALGFESNLELEKTPKIYQILGNDLDGFAGFLELEFKDGKLEKVKPKNL